MTRHVAFLRGVNNVGKSTRVSMADLRDLFEGMGFRDVRTVRNSGNVIFSATGKGQSRVHARIEKELLAKLGIAPRVIVLGADEIGTIVRNNPFADFATDHSRLLVLVPRESSDLAQLGSRLDKSWAPELLAVDRRVAYLWCAKGVGESSLWPAVDRAFNGSITARNMGTMTRIMSVLQESAT